MALAKGDIGAPGVAARRLAFSPAIWGWGPAVGAAVWATGLLVLPWWVAVFLWWWPSVLLGSALGFSTIWLANRLAGRIGGSDSVSRSPPPAPSRAALAVAPVVTPGGRDIAPATGPQRPPLRVMHVITRLICGGADENTVISCNAQARTGHDVWLVYGAGSSARMLAELDPRVRTLHVASLQREIAPASDVRALVGLWRTTREIRPDVVHTHTSKAGVLGRLAGWLAGAPLIIHGVHILPFVNVGRASSVAYIAIERALAPLTHAFINVSEGTRDGNLAAHIGRPAQHHVVYSGMDCDRFRHAQPFSGRELSELLESEPSARQQGGRPQLVLYAAAFEPRKRHLELLDVFATIVREAPCAHLVLLGEGPGQAEAEARIASLGLKSRVHLLGYRSDIERWIASADLCVMSSEREGLPRTVLQYVMAGKPVVATALPGLERVVRHGVSGYLVPVSDVGQIAPAIVALLKDDLRRRRFAAAAREIDLSDWSAARMTRAIETIYSSAAPPRTRARPHAPSTRRSAAPQL